MDEFSYFIGSIRLSCFGLDIRNPICLLFAELGEM